MARLTALLVALVLAGCGEDRQGPPLMWSVQAQGSASTSHLFGTMHIGISARDELPTAVWDAFDGSTRLVEEAEIRFIDPQEYLALVSLPSGQLDQLLPEDVWLDLIALLPKVSLERLRALRPWAAASLVFNELVPEVEGMDLTFLDAASAAGKERAFLEVWQDQVNAMNQIPLQDDADFLTGLVRDRKIYTERLAELNALYKAGDVEGVLARAPAAGAIPEPGSALFDSFILQRNDRWLPRLEPHLKAGGVFVAVGFGHVIGPHGLVQTLAKRGYTVTRVE